MRSETAGRGHAAERLLRLPPYLFAEIDRQRKEAEGRGVDVIDLGVGDPDLNPPASVVAALREASGRTGVHRYSSYNGTPDLRRACAEWMESQFGVQLDPDTEILPLLGSKEGIGHVALALLDPQDEVLVPDPAYPVYQAGTILAGATPVTLPLRAENGFLPDLDELDGLATARTRILWLNYPCNPTTALADRAFFDSIVAWAARRGVVVCHDAAYVQMAFDPQKRISFLQSDGAREVGVEFHSLSKTFCMAGWRVGFVAGSRRVISALAKVKTNLDSGIFLPVEAAAAEALLHGSTGAAELLEAYRKRRDRFVAGLAGIGWQVPCPEATFYIWAPVPAGHDSMSLSAVLLERAGVVCTPGVGFGRFGEGYVRMSLTTAQERLDAAVARIGEAGVF